MALFDKVISVFGATGSLGRCIINRIIKSGYLVRVLTNDVDASHFLSFYGFVGQLELMRINHNDELELKNIIKNSFAVIYCREITNIVASKVETKFVSNLLSCSKDSDVKFLIIESLLQDSMHIVCNDNTAVLRTNLTFAREDKFFHKLGGVANLLRIVPFLKSDACVTLRPVYVGDVALVIQDILSATISCKMTYIVNGSKEYTILSLAKLIAKSCGLPECRIMALPRFFAKIALWQNMVLDLRYYNENIKNFKSSIIGVHKNEHCNNNVHLCITTDLESHMSRDLLRHNVNL